MYRFLLTPRWWGINVFVVLAIPVCLFMGSWQLTRFEAQVETHREQERAAERAGERNGGERAEPLAALLPVTKESNGRMARATGRYDTGRQLLVPDRRLDDADGFYVLSLLRTDSGRALPVVRGWLPGDADVPADTADVPAPPRGEVAVTGAVQASESESGHSTAGLPEGQLGLVSAAALVNMVPYDLYDAWITVQDPDGPLRPVPPVAAAGTGLDLKAFQNLGYTAEWFVFAGFVIFMWFRLFRRETELARDAELGLTPGDPPPDGPEPRTEPAPADGPEPVAARDASGAPEASNAAGAPGGPGTPVDPGAADAARATSSAAGP